MTKHCKTCTCVIVEEPKVHKHYFNESPSYTIRTTSELKKVWVCANKLDGYCHESKEKTTNV